jgi:hypothetical protein
MELTPYGYKDGDLQMQIIETFEYDQRQLAVTQCGHMIGVFDVISGGKIYAYDAFSEQDFNKSCIKVKSTALAIIDNNPQWSTILDQLPILNIIP